jgi:CRISPR-associated endonuclease/helicase Cas3
MGEGKTNTALTAAEMLAARFGADGVLVGMPTQATSDPMFTNVRDWVGKVGAGLDGQVALLHGKRRFNREWRELLEAGGDSPDDFYGGVAEDDPYGLNPAVFGEDDHCERKAPAEWFLGSKRGLLSPFVVGTIDQLLFAATRTKHVMLRMAGLAGKVVVLDEVHAADVYMSQFLMEGLWWLGQAGVPVVLLSATLPPAQRQALVAAYLAGAASQEDFEVSELPKSRGYPSVTAAWMGAEGAEYLVEHAPSWRKDLKVGVEVLAEGPTTSSNRWGEDAQDQPGVSPADEAVADLLEERLQDGGCALIIRNTVPRAQDTYRALRQRFGGQVRLLHGRLHAEHRAERTQECLELLGPPGEGRRPRPSQLIVVATQLAEQSFDVDADLLVTDLAPIDLLLQRIGRVHRRADTHRPERVSVPRVVVTGFAPRSGAAPSILPASKGIYGRYLLLRTAALVTAVDGGEWSVPGQVPSLVAQVYGEDAQVVPAEWAEAEREAYREWTDKQRRRAESAAPFLLTRFGEHTSATLDGLHYGGSPQGLKEQQFQALVRDGEPSIEVVLVRGDERGFQTLRGRSLGVNGEASVDLLDEVLGATVRLPSKLTEVAERDLTPLDGWRDHPWLRYSKALVLNEQASAALGDYTLRYDEDLGLIVQGGPPYR